MSLLYYKLSDIGVPHSATISRLSDDENRQTTTDLVTYLQLPEMMSPKRNGSPVRENLREFGPAVRTETLTTVEKLETFDTNSTAWRGSDVFQKIHGCL